MTKEETAAKTISAEGKDAICFTAGFSGALFGAGTIHAYLAARRPPPQVAAGISMGALSTAAMQRCYQDIGAAKPGEEESARWAWFRRYLTALHDRPLNVFWDSIPDQSDFFADFPPILDASTHPELRESEREARRRRYLLVKLGQWMAGLPVKVRTMTSTAVGWVRSHEKYPGWKIRRWMDFAFSAVSLIGGLSRHITFAPQFFSYRYELEKWKTRIPWWGRPLFGWKIWLLSFIPVIIVLLAALLLATPFIAAFNWNQPTPYGLGAAAKFLSQFSIPLPVIQFVLTFFASLVVFVVETVAFLFAGAIIAENGTALLRALLKNTGLTESLIHDFHLRRKLTELFDPEVQGVRIQKDPMEILLVSAWLNTLRDPAGKPLRADQRWAANGSLLVDSLRTSLTKVPIFAPTRLDSEADILQWVGRDVKQGRAQMPKGLDLVDGSCVRENPLPALFSFLRLRDSIAGQLSSHGYEPSIHVVYSVPLPTDRSDGCIPDEDTNIVSVAMASLRLAKRRDTQLEVMQTNFMSKLEQEIRDRHDALNNSGQAPAAPPPPFEGPSSSSEVASSKVFPIFVDEIAPESDLAFKNPINPTRAESLTAVASGCRRTLQTLYCQILADPAKAGETVKCADFLDELVQLRDPGAAPLAVYGLPEVCKHCTGELIRPSPEQCLNWFKKRSVEFECRALPSTGDRTLLERFPQLAGTQPRIVFVASGGVFRGAFHIGMIAALVQTRVKPDLILGASVGTLMGGALGALFSVPKEVQRWELLGKLVQVFLHVDEKVAFTKTLKTASRELGVRGRSVNLSPAQVRRVVRKGARSDPGFAVSGAPPAVVDAISDVFMIPHRKTVAIAAELISGHVTKATYAFLNQLRSESLKRLDIECAVMGASLLEQVASELLGAPILRLDHAQPYKDIAFFATTTDLGSQNPYIFGKYPADPRIPYDFVEAGLASAAFPCVFAPRRESDVLPGKGATDVRYSDGGMFDNLPFLPAIDVLSAVQHEYRQSVTGLSARDFLKQRYRNPDLFLAGSLNVNPENDPGDDGKKNHPFETIFSIYKRTNLLQNNQKIRGFEWAAEMVHSRLRELLGLVYDSRATFTSDSEQLLDNIVNSAVMPIFPSSPDHLNGTFEFCASLGMKPEKIQRSIADGCFQTLKSFADASTGTSFVSQVVQNFQALSAPGGGSRIPKVTSKDPKASTGKSVCPYFTIDSLDFACPFQSASLVQDSEQKHKEVFHIFETCVKDKSHAKSIQEQRRLEVVP